MTTEIKTAARLTIEAASDMTPEGRRAIAAWLRRQANFMRDHGAEYAPRYRARFHYRVDPAEAHRARLQDETAQL